jgi:predicted metal-binding protein
METVKSLPAKNELEKFDFLRKMASDLGASDAKVIPTSKIVVEDRVVLKCKVGCNNYGKSLACPPYTPSAEEFRKIVGEYSYALFMKFTSKAEADADLQQSLSKSGGDPSMTSDMKLKVDEFWAAWKADKKEMLASVVKLEKEAMHKGYALAISFISGSCQLCDKCNTETRICAHPEMARYSEDAVGVNVKKTAKNAGISFVFPYPKNPESFALLLID